MFFPKNIIFEILYFLEWNEFYNILKHYGFNITKQLKIYAKYNDSLSYFECVGDACCEDVEYLEIVKYLHSIGKPSSFMAIDLAGSMGYLETVKYLHSIGIKGCNLHSWAKSHNQTAVIDYLSLPRYIKKNK
jgi:enhancing lycopene biosynthesis protein 2